MEDDVLSALAVPDAPASFAERIRRRKTELLEARRALEELRPQAEELAGQIQNAHQRRFIEAYCLDGMRFKEAAALCGVSERQALRYLQTLREYDRAD